MPTLKDLLTKEKAEFVSVVREGKNVTYVRGFKLNADIKVEKKEKYWVKTTSGLKEKTAE